MLLTFAATVAHADVVLSGALGVGATYSPCYYEVPTDTDPVRVSPSASVAVSGRWPQSELFVGVSSAPLLGYLCSSLPVSHMVALEGGWLGRAGQVAWGPFMAIGMDDYIATGVHVERPIHVGKLTLAPAIRFSVAYPLVAEAHALLRVSRQVR